MRRSILILVLAVACSPASVAESPSRGGFANGICQPTTRTDDMGIITATGSFGLLGPVRASADDSLNDEILVVWRDGETVAFEDVDDDWSSGFALSTAEFVAFLEGRTPAYELTAAGGIEVLRLVLALGRSLETGEGVALDG